MKHRVFHRPVFATCVQWLLVAMGWAALADRGVGLEYLDNQALAQRLEALAQTDRQLVRVQSVARTLGKNDVWLAELGGGGGEERRRRPASLAIAGIEGNDLAGTVTLVAWVEGLARNYSTDTRTRQLLDSTTIYVFPRANPDAAASFFAKPKVEHTGNNRPMDDDHDGLTDEDGPDDLDGDGLITWMRVQDPEGEYIPDPAEPRLLLKADKAKGEVGAWRLFSEGRDDDHDEAWNEDGPGGVNLNRNFPYNYRFFAAGSGIHQVSEVETRALADFVVAHPNIGIVFTFGAADNLVQTPKGEAPKRPPTAMHEEDIPFYRELGKAWREALGLKKELTGSSEPGTFSDWMYFHRGRLSLAARPWSPALALELAKSKAGKEGDKPKDEKSPGDESAETKKEAKPEKPAPKKEDTRNEEDRAFLKWLDEHAPAAFVPWKPFAHPDFPGRKVEIGGFAPFAKVNPPEKLLAELAQQQGQFLTGLAGKLPRVGIRKAEVKHLGNRIYDVTIQVENAGYLPTALAQGSLTREVDPTRVVLNLDQREILSGTKTTMLGPIEGSGGMKEVRYILHAKDRTNVEVQVISTLGGSARTTLELKEGK